MHVEFVEKYVSLGDMEIGDTATSKDRNEFYVCGYHYDSLKKQNVKVIMNLNKLNDQYTDNRNLDTPVKILESGDLFKCKA